MSIRTITPPMNTVYGPDTTAQFAELRDLKISVDYKDEGSGIEQFVKIRIEMEVWQGGSSASVGASPVRTDVFEYEVKPSDDAWPLTKAHWDSLRSYIYDTVMNDTANPVDDPQAYNRGTVFFD